MYGRQSERSTAGRGRVAMRQLLLSADVVCRLHGQMVCIASKPIRKRGLAATEVHVSYVSSHLLHPRRVLYRIGAIVIVKRWREKRHNLRIADILILLKIHFNSLRSYFDWHEISSNPINRYVCLCVWFNSIDSNAHYYKLWIKYQIFNKLQLICNNNFVCR